MAFPNEVNVERFVPREAAAKSVETESGEMESWARVTDQIPLGGPAERERNSGEQLCRATSYCIGTFV